MNYTFWLLALTLALVPIFRISGPWDYGYPEAKNQLLIFMMGVLCAAGFLFLLFPAVADLPSLSLLLFCSYLTLTCTWSDNVKNSFQDIPRWWALFIFFQFCRQIPRDPLLVAIFLPAVAMALYGLIQETSQRDPLDRFYHGVLRETKTRLLRLDAWLGNPNYTGSYLVVPFFIGLYLACVYSYYYLIPTSIILLAIGYSHCRAAQLGCIIGLSIFNPYLLLLAAGFLILVTMSPWRSGLKAAWGGRKHYYIYGWDLFKQNPIFGNGLRVLRRRIFRIQARRKPQQYELGKRFHQEYLQTLVEAGVLGLGLMVLFLGSVLIRALPEPFLVGGLIALLIDAFFFYPFRSAATSLPFWALAGVICGPVAVIQLPLIWTIPISLIIFYLTYLHSLKPMIGNYYYQLSLREKDPKKAVALINEALKRDNTRTMYLSHAAEIYMDINTTIASIYAQRSQHHFDGEKIEWAHYTICGEIFAADGNLLQARNAFQMALYLNPYFEPAKKDLEEVEKAIKNFTAPVSVDDTPSPSPGTASGTPSES